VYAFYSANEWKMGACTEASSLHSQVVHLRTIAGSPAVHVKLRRVSSSTWGGRMRVVGSLSLLRTNSEAAYAAASLSLSYTVLWSMLCASSKQSVLNAKLEDESSIAANKNVHRPERNPKAVLQRNPTWNLDRCPREDTVVPGCQKGCVLSRRQLCEICQLNSTPSSIKRQRHV